MCRHCQQKVEYGVWTQSICDCKDADLNGALQEMKLHEAVDPNGEGLSLLHYQFSTLQFILGQLEDAQKLAQRSYELALCSSRADSDQASQAAPFNLG